jgi:hypothetical protein
MQYPAENLSLEHMLIGEIIKEYPETSEVMERYFGMNCFRRHGFEIQTLGMACILSGVDQKQLLQEFRLIQH